MGLDNIWIKGRISQCWKLIYLRKYDIDFKTICRWLLDERWQRRVVTSPLWTLCLLPAVTLWHALNPCEKGG